MGLDWARANSILLSGPVSLEAVIRLRRIASLASGLATYGLMLLSLTLSCSFPTRLVRQNISYILVY